VNTNLGFKNIEANIEIAKKAKLRMIGLILLLKHGHRFHKKISCELSKTRNSEDF
jgi:hypothetical protein